MELYERFHDRCFELTGDRWCPYPSQLFMETILEVDDRTAIELIDERRTFLFPHFLMGEPQEEKLLSLKK